MREKLISQKQIKQFNNLRKTINASCLFVMDKDSSNIDYDLIDKDDIKLCKKIGGFLKRLKKAKTNEEALIILGELIGASERITTGMEYKTYAMVIARTKEILEINDGFPVVTKLMKKFKKWLKKQNS